MRYRTRSKTFVTVLASALLAGCAPDGAPPPQAPVPKTVGGPGSAPRAEGAREAAPPRPPLAAIHDDMPGAMARARAEGKAVLVDAWAPWCHTCLSMKSFVLPDASLAPLEGRVVLAAIDTDRPENASFLEKHAVSVWPTFFVIDPATDRVLGYWPGSASASELRTFVEESARALDDARAAREPPGSPARELAEARAAHAAADYGRAAKSYERAVKGLPEASPRRSEALSGLIQALFQAKDYAACARVGRTHLADVKGAAMPADFASFLLACAEKLPSGPDATAARKAAVERLQAITASPHPEASADDRADALSILADALKDSGDKEGMRKAHAARLAVLEEAAKAAKSPEIAATFDYARAGAYVALGRADEAVKMLSEREKEMPQSYEPPARLADVLAKIDRLPEALAAVDRAIARAYGPRRLRYLKLRAEIQGRLGDAKGQAATLREEVAGHEALTKGHADKERLEDARRRLAEAEKRAATGDGSGATSSARKPTPVR